MTGLSFLKGTRALVKSFIARVTSDGGIIEAAKCIGDLDADLAMQPSGYKATKLYSEKPSTGVGDFTVDRNSTATRVNSLGFIESVAANVPRLDYTDGNCPSLLLEPQGTNLITYSEDFNNAYWLKQSGGTGSIPIVTSNQGISPDGTNTADRVVFNSGGTSSASNHSTLASSTISCSILNNRSVYFKSFDGSNYDLFIGSTAPNAAGITVTITSEWQRFDLNHTPSSSITNIYLSTRALFGGTPSNTADVLIWGAQLEESSFATSHIPTSGTTVTRLADVVGGAGDVNTINSTEGVLYAEISAFDGSNDTFGISLNDGSSNNRIFLSLLTPSSVYRAFSTGGGNITFTGLDVTSTSKVAVRYSFNNFSLWVNGVKRGEDLVYAGISANTLNNLSFDRNGFGEFNFYGRVKDLEYYKTALTDERLIYITGTLNENYYNTYFDMSNALNYTPQ
jgi:hypothetical protein